MSLNESAKTKFRLRIQVAIIIFSLIFFFSSLLIIVFHVLVTTRSFDNIIISQLDDLKQGQRIVNITKDIVSRNFWNSLVSVLLLNALIDLVVAYVVSVWISRPIENLLFALNTAYQRGIPYVNFADKKYSEIDEISQVVSDMTGKYINALELQNLFLQDISHELKTPLAAVKSTADLINMTPLPTIDDYKYFFTTSQQMNQRMINLVNQLTLTNKADSEIYEYEDLNLSNLVKDAVKIYFPQAEAKKIKLHFDVENDLHIKGSSKYLNIALSNIIDNAIKYSNKENTEVSILLTRKRTHILLEVKDHGIGIPEVDLKKIYDRFYRGQNSKEASGTGLGLSITKKIIKAHKGKIKLESKQGVGTKISITFKL